MTPAERDLGARTSGVWTTTAARAAGLSPAQIRRRLEQGEWQAVRRGVYCDGGVVPNPIMRASAATQRAGHDAVAVGRTAARVWGIALVDDEDPATDRHELTHDDVSVARGRGAGPTLHTRSLTLGPEATTVLGGVRLLAPVSTLVDLARILRPDALVAAIDSALFRRRVTLAEVEAAAESRLWWPGAPALRQALALCDPLAESPHESLTRLVVKPLLPGLRSQVKVYDGRGRLDLGDEQLLLGIESDGAAYHRGAAARDRARDRRTGWTIERVSWYETRRQQDQLRARIRATAADLRQGRAA